MPSGEAWTLLFRNTWLSTAKKNISIIGCEPLPQLVNLLLDYNMLRLACVMPSDRGKLLVEVGESISAVEADLERYRTRDALSSLLLDLAPWAKVKTGKITVSFDQSEREKEIWARFDALDLGAKPAVVRAVCRSIVILPDPPGVKPTTASAKERVVIIGVGEEDTEQ